MKKQNYMPISHNQLAKTKIIHKQSVTKKREEYMVGNAFNVSLLFSVYALRNEFDFSTIRIERFIERFKDTLEGYNGGWVNFSQINDTIYEETGIRVIDKDGAEALDKYYKFREDR